MFQGLVGVTAEARASTTPALWLCRASILLGWVMILCGLGLFASECVTWLRVEVWHQSSLADLWGHLPLGGDRTPAGWEEMQGLHRILYRVLRWCGRCPISLLLLVLGLAIAWTGNDAHERAERALAGRHRRPRER